MPAMMEKNVVCSGRRVVCQVKSCYFFEYQMLHQRQPLTAVKIRLQELRIGCRRGTMHA